MIIRLLARMLVVVLALVILFISVARAGLEIMASDNSSPKNNEINFKIVNKDGEVVATAYKFSET